MKGNLKIVFIFLFIVFCLGMGIFNNILQAKNQIAMEESYNKVEKNGDVELVSSNNVEQEEVFSSENDYFIESKIEREKNYSQTIETYQNMINSKEISAEQKAVAVNEIDKIANQKNIISITENLIKNKGFKDVVIFINEESVSIVVKSKVSLMTEQIAQIQNIASRELKVEIEKINISIKE